MFLVGARDDERKQIIVTETEEERYNLDNL